MEACTDPCYRQQAQLSVHYAGSRLACSKAEEGSPRQLHVWTPVLQCGRYRMSRLRSVSCWIQVSIAHSCQRSVALKVATLHVSIHHFSVSCSCIMSRCAAVALLCMQSCVL